MLNRRAGENQELKATRHSEATLGQKIHVASRFKENVVTFMTQLLL